MSQLRDHTQPPSPPTTAFATTTTIAPNTTATDSTARLNNGNGVDTVLSKERGGEEEGDKNNLRESAKRGNLRR